MLAWAFLMRWVFAFLLVAATFNPTELNYIQWARTNYQAQTPLTVFLGVALLVGYVIYLRATLRSIGRWGMLLVAALFGSLLWVLYDWHVLTVANTDLNIWMGLLALSLVLGTGLSWSIFRRAISGQIDDTDAP